MKLIRSFWFTTLNDTFGIVVGEDDFTKKRKAYCGVVTGEDQGSDEKLIMRNGSPVNAGLLREVLNLLEPPVPEEVIASDVTEQADQ